MTLISAPPFINKINSTDIKKKKSSFSKLQSINFSFLFAKRDPPVVIVEDDVPPRPTPQSTLPKSRLRSARPVSQFFPTTVVKEDDDCNRSNIKKIRKSMDFNDTRYMSSLTPIKELNAKKDVNPATIPPEVIELPKDIISKEDAPIFENTLKKKPLSRSATNPRRISISGATVSRARSVFGLDSLKNRETKAISMWKNVVSQLITNERENDNLGDHNNDLLLQTPFNPERQRFVQQSVKDLAMAKFISSELVATEESFYKLLLLIKSRYKDPMIIASQKKYPLVKSTDIPLLFNHLPELIRISEKLLLSLKACQNLKDIGSTFRRLEPEFAVFLKYAMHYKNNIKAIRKACTNVLFLKIDQETLAKKDSNRLGMADYLIAPIQRIPRYCLLIKDLRKYTHPSYTDHTELNYVLKTLTGLAVVMDHVQQPGPMLATRNTTKTL